MKNFRKLVYVISFLIFWPLASLLPFRLYLALIKLLGLFTSFFYFKRRKVARNNLLMMRDFSREHIDTVLKEGLHVAAMFGFFDFILGKWTPELCRKYVIIEGQENYLQVAAQNRGVLVAFIHSNTFNVVFPCLGFLQKMHTLVILESDGSLVSTLHAKIRRTMWESAKKLSYVYLNKEESATLKIRRMLKEGKVVNISADGQHTGKFFSLPFFDKKILLPTGIFKLSALCQSPIIPLFSGFDRKGNVFRVHLGSPIISQKPEEAADLFVRQFQKHIMKFPSHWAGWWRMKLVKDEKGEEVFDLYSV
jgi:lauroyl/myristoyl acyltransferase